MLIAIVILVTEVITTAQAAPESNKPEKKPMRDKRFIAVHRGGPLSVEDHRLIVCWAADCAERVLPLFEAEGDDRRPREAIEIARAWVKGEVPTGAAQKAAYAAHAAAREAKSPVAQSAARAAGQAVATAHFADHSLVASNYALKTILFSGQSVKDEYSWQTFMIPEAVRSLIVSGYEQRFRDYIAEIKEAGQGGTGQPATRPESKSEGNQKPQSEAEGRSR